MIYGEADEALFADIVRGVAADRERLDETLSAALSEEWPLPRLETLLRLILEAGAYELVHRPDIPPRVTISEYVAIAYAFFAGKRAGAGERRPRPPRPHAARRARSVARPMSARDEASASSAASGAFSRRSPGRAGSASTDDAALVDCAAGQRLVVTVDAMVEGVHYLPDDPPDLVARSCCGSTCPISRRWARGRCITC